MTKAIVRTVRYYIEFEKPDGSDIDDKLMEELKMNMKVLTPRPFASLLKNNVIMRQQEISADVDETISLSHPILKELVNPS